MPIQSATRAGLPANVRKEWFGTVHCSPLQLYHMVVNVFKYLQRNTAVIVLVICACMTALGGWLVPSLPAVDTAPTVGPP
jgi:hypothetical protein